MVEEGVVKGRGFWVGRDEECKSRKLGQWPADIIVRFHLAANAWRAPGDQIITRSSDEIVANSAQTGGAVFAQERRSGQVRQVRLHFTYNISNYSY